MFNTVLVKTCNGSDLRHCVSDHANPSGYKRHQQGWNCGGGGWVGGWGKVEHSLQFMCTDAHF